MILYLSDLMDFKMEILFFSQDDIKKIKENGFTLEGCRAVRH